MSASFNKVIIMGNLGQDPELRYTPSQVPVVTLSVATTDYRKDASGNSQEVTDWHRVVVWNKQAENCSKYLAKGRSVLVDGRLQTRSWVDKTTGQKRYATEIIANSVQFLGTGNRQGVSPGMSDSPSYNQGDDQGMMSSPSAQNTGSSFGQTQEESPLEEIPF